jgi:hypothetical protein
VNKKFNSFWAFYPFYLSQHQDPLCRGLHYLGSLFTIALLLLACITQNFWWLFFTPIIGYGFAWIGHFGFEHNRPATFQYPLYSFLGDWVMFVQWLRSIMRIK